jgi:hypothetical protein
MTHDVPVLKNLSENDVQLLCDLWVWRLKLVNVFVVAPSSQTHQVLQFRSSTRPQELLQLWHLVDHIIDCRIVETHERVNKMQRELDEVENTLFPSVPPEFHQHYSECQRQIRILQDVMQATMVRGQPELVYVLLFQCKLSQIECDPDPVPFDAALQLLIYNQHEYRRLTKKYAVCPFHLEWLSLASKTNKVRRELACLELCKVDWQEWKQKIFIPEPQDMWIMRMEQFLHDVGKVVELYTDHVSSLLTCVERFEQREARLLELRKLYEHMTLCYEIRLEVVWIKVYCYLERHPQPQQTLSFFWLVLLPMLCMHYILLRRCRKAAYQACQRYSVLEVFRDCGEWKWLPREIWRNVVACYI